MSWTDERIEELRRLWAEGLSASQIAKMLGGVTRNAVIGKIHRMGLSGRVKTVRANKPRAAAPAPQRKAPAARPAGPSPAPRVMAVGSAAVKVVGREALLEAPAPVSLPAPAAAVVPIGGGVSFLELSPTQCRWPVGDPVGDEFVFCGARCESGEVYCRGHGEVAFPSRAKARAKAR